MKEEAKEMLKSLSALRENFNGLQLEQETFLYSFKEKFIKLVKNSNIADLLILILILERPEKVFDFLNLNSIEEKHKKETVEWLLSQKELKEKLKEKCKGLMIANKWFSSYGELKDLFRLSFLDSVLPGIKDLFLKDLFPEQNPTKKLEALERFSKLAAAPHKPDDKIKYDNAPFAPRGEIKK